MQPDEVFTAALAKAATLAGKVPIDDAAAERARTECSAFFDLVPEPPVYRRRDDPAQAKASELLGRGEDVLARCLVLQQEPRFQATLTPWVAALRAYLEMLCHTASGRIPQAERAWTAALELENRASSSRRLWARSDEALPKVYDPKAQRSRFDPRPDPQLTAKLMCPQPNCQRPNEFQLSPGISTHRFVCPACRYPFNAFLGEARGVELFAAPGGGKRYVFTVEELAGGMSRVEFVESSGASFIVARRDLLAFLYSPAHQLRSVLNLSSSRLLWVQRGGACFVATAAFGDHAPELAAFRAFRDRVLMPRAAGRQVVCGYYRWGPGLAGFIRRRPVLRRATRSLLGRIHRGLLRNGYGD